MLTALHIAARTLFWIVMALGLGLALFLLRLDSGPIELAWLKPRIEQALTPAGGEVAVTAGNIELRLNKEERTLDLVGVDVRYQASGSEDPAAAPLLAFPEVGLTLSVEAFLKHGLVAASSVHAEAPSLVVVRREDGIIDLSLEGDDDSREQHLDIAALVRKFLHPAEADERIAYLHSLQISGGRVAFYDRVRATALTARDGDLVLIREDGGVDGWLQADVQQPSADPVSVQLAGRVEPGVDRVPFTLELADLMPSDLGELWPLAAPSIPPELAGLRLPLRASIEGEVGADGSLSPLAFDIAATAGVVDLPGHFARPLDIEHAAFEGRLDRDFTSVAFDHASIVSRGANLEGKGRIGWRADQPSIALDLVAADVHAADVPAFWPISLGGKSRDWVRENVQAGIVKTAEIKLDLRPEDLAQEPLRGQAIEGTFAFEDVTVRYLDGMPPVENAFGKAVFDADRMAFEVEGATSAGIALKGGSVTITGMGKPGKNAARLRVLTDAAGSIDHMLALLDQPPLGVAADIGIVPAATAGNVAAEIEVRLPLHDGVTGDEAVVLAKAALTDLAIERLPKLGGDLRLDQGRFDLTLDEEAVRLEGRAAVNGVPMAIDVLEPLAENASTRRIVIAGSLSREQLASQGLPVDGLDGAFDFEATVTETGTHFWIDLEADLAALALAPPGLAWKKPVGQEGILRASIAVPIDGPIEVRQFTIASGELDASGSFSLSDAGLQSLVLDRFRLADSDALIRYAPDGQGGYDLVVEAARLDLDALFGDDQGVNSAFERFRAVLRADQFRARGIELLDVEADASHTAEGWRSASAIGTLLAGGRIALELTPEDDHGRLEVRSDNAGALIEALDLGQRVEGGSLQLSTRLDDQDPPQAEGRLEITGFILRDAPLLARMLTLASLNGIGSLLGGEGIQMDHMILPFTLEDRTLTFEDGLMRGSQLGLTIKGDVVLDDETIDLAGTIIPVYSLNRLIGQVPVIGRILTGVDGRGAFAATYSIEGPNENPTVYVNPLSILTPGLIRDFFGGLLNGTLEAPEIRETDD